MIRKNRALAAILAGILAFVMLFSVFYIVLEADHDCIGDDCAICAVLSVCENILHRLLSAGCAAALLLFPESLFTFAEKRPVFTLRTVTPVSLRVKLSN